VSDLGEGFGIERGPDACQHVSDIILSIPFSRLTVVVGDAVCFRICMNIKLELPLFLLLLHFFFVFFFRCDGFGYLRFSLVSLILCKLIYTAAKLILSVGFPVHSGQEEVPILNFLFFAW
jgi:uncharacterized protein YybS (DUF2232 family)